MDPYVEGLQAEVRNRCQDHTAHEDVVQMERMIDLMADGEPRDEDTIIYYTMVLDQADFYTGLAGLIRKRLVEVTLPEGADGDHIDNYLIRPVAGDRG